MEQLELQGLENRLSKGLDNIVKGYVDYAEKVITDRALCDVRDGLKPVQRRILWTCKEMKLKDKLKCAKIVGNVFTYHPHGDSSIYKAMVLMTENNGTLPFPLLKGQGNFGGFYKTDPPAAMRYTEAGLSKYAEEYFRNMNGVELIPNFDSSAIEPDVLPVSFPAVLLNSLSGIAVGFRSNIPSFNFNDVLDLTMEYIRDGKCSTVIEPDFVSGGYYVRNNKELMKLMQTGSAKLKLRGKVEQKATSKEIMIVEFPYGKTLQGLKKQIEDKENPYITSVADFDDMNGAGLWVNCSAKKYTTEVLHQLYKGTDLQYTYTADMTVICDGKPRRMGVWGIIEEWCKWRRQVLERDFKYQLEICKESIKESRAFMLIVSDKVKRDEIRRLLDYEGVDSAVAYILENYDNEIVTPELAQWIVRRGANNFRDGGKYKTLYEEKQREQEALEKKLKDIDGVIIEQLEELKMKYGSEFPRRTEVTVLDYEFKEDEEEIKDKTECVYTLKQGFLKKTKVSNQIDEDVLFKVNATASDTLLAIDNRGRVLRIYGTDIPYHSNTEYGVYLQNYFGLSETEDYKLMWLGVLDGSTKLIIYKDGNVGCLETSEWYNQKRQVKVVEKGISKLGVEVFGAVIDMPEVLFVTDTSGKLAYIETSEIMRKHRTARTKVFQVKKGEFIDSYYTCGVEGIENVVTEKEKYKAPKLSKITLEEFCGDVDKFKLIV